MPRTYIEKNIRATIAGLVVGLTLLLLIGGLFYHQISRHSLFLQKSEDNRIHIQPTVPKRGLIYDRNLKVIADNRLSFTVSIVPAERVDDVTIPKLAKLLNTDTAVIRKKFKTNYIGKYIPVPVKRGQRMDVISVLEERGSDYPGVTYTAESVRRYEDNMSAETFVGHVGEVSSDEIKKYKYDEYRLGSLIGKKGIERSYDRKLRGLEGTDFIEVSARGQIIGLYKHKERIPPVPGNDIVLSIDKDLQRFCVENFDSVQCCGTVVAIDPRNGEILALASFPHFDPNIFSGVIDTDTWQAIVSDTNHPLLNRPMAGMYTCGSTAKLITAGAALELGLITDEYLLKPCYGGMQFGNRFFKCWEGGGHGKLNLYHAIEQSCNVYFYQVGQMLGVDKWAEYASGCGFGQKSGIDIPGEMAGLVPNSDYYDKLYGPGKWSPYLVLNLAIGQGEFTVTPLQLAQFYCGLANDGVVYKPHLLKELIRPDGSFERNEPEVSFKLPFNAKTLDVLKKGLVMVVHGEKGTARAQKTDMYMTAGKTGTAQNPHGDEHAWFSAFAPADDPQIVCIALVENAGHGSEKAAPIVGKILKYYLSKKISTFAAADSAETE